MGKGAFSKFLFLGGMKNVEKPDNNDDNDNNFDGRKIFRHSSLKCPKNSKIRERISGKKSLLSSSSSSSSSSS
jgi:hypothetical protein